MNKLLPILLVVVLSGCGGELKTPLENCADDKMGLSIQYESYYNDILTMPKKEFIKKYTKFDDIVMYNRAELHAIVYKQNSKIRGLSLKSKLEHKEYEKYFKKCERERKGYPATFDAKWK